MPHPAFLRFALIVLVLAVGSDRAAASDKPNIIFILADDLGWTDLGCQGSKFYETPAIDRLAAKGMRFTDGYTCGPNCQPTRAALLSGQYGPRTGVYTVGNINRFNWQSRPLRPVDNVVSLPLNRITLAESLQKAGYVTAMFGKWHLGQDEKHHPSKRGFSEAIVSMGKHFNFATSPKTEYPKGAYLADWLTDKAVDFIKRNKEKPFFLYLPHFGVHSPFDAKPDLVARFKNKESVGGHKSAVYAAMIASVDESVGRIIQVLTDLNLLENTLVIFSSDNGGVGGYVREGLANAGGVTDNAPLRGGKGMLYEGGVRVPWIFFRPGMIAPGQTSSEPINSVDLFPTLLALVGARPEKSQVLDGVNYLGVLRGEKGARRAGPLYWHFPGYLGAGAKAWRTTPAGAIREGEWKLQEFFEDGRLELYNLKTDLGQKTNLAKSQPEKLKELHDKLVAWRKEIAAPMPTKNAAKKKE